MSMDATLQTPLLSVDAAHWMGVCLVSHSAIQSLAWLSSSTVSHLMPSACTSTYVTIYLECSLAFGSSPITDTPVHRLSQLRPPRQGPENKHPRTCFVHSKRKPPRPFIGAIPPSSLTLMEVSPVPNQRSQVQTGPRRSHQTHHRQHMKSPL